MILLDTDCLAFILYGNTPEGTLLANRLSVLGESVRTTVVSIEEGFRGWLAAINSAANKDRLLRAYQRLSRLARAIPTFEIVDYDDRAHEIANDLRKQKIRVGTMDLRIAAIAMSQDAVLVTRNLKDFSKIPGLRAEDWIGARQ